MTPEDVRLVVRDVETFRADGDRFTREFYATLFDVAPEVRPLFDADIDAQRRKLFDELDVLVGRAVGVIDESSASSFVERAARLGERHEVYGVTPDMYHHVRTALLAALRSVVERFDDEHERAWSHLYRLVADAMQSS